MSNSSSQWRVEDLSKSYVADVSVVDRQEQVDDKTGRPFEIIKIHSPSVYLNPDKYFLVSPNGERTKIQVIDEPVGGVYTAGKVA
jgi:hypothetical protein